jgi:hypothetical protein
MAWKKEICTALLFLLACVSTIAVITACEPDYQKAGRRTGELYNEAGTVVVLEPTARAERLATDAAQAGDRGVRRCCDASGMLCCHCGRSATAPRVAYSGFLNGCLFGLHLRCFCDTLVHLEDAYTQARQQPL